MKSMKKSLSMNKVIGSFRKRGNGSPGPSGASGPSDNGAPPAAAVSNPGQSPVESARASVRAFCESGGNVQGDEILFLPPIVDAAESSPAAAAECARVIGKFLDKSYNSRPSWQYNALMLVRILTDNPGETFTRNLGGEFPERCRKLLKHVREKRVHRMLMETLDDFERSRSWDENLRPLIEMWKAQKDAAYEDYAKTHGRIPAALQQQQQQQFFQQAAFSPIPMNPHSQNYFARAPQFNGSAGTSTQNNASRAKRLPDPVELTSRLEEARTSAKLLEQVVINTPPAEVLDNELIKEFADRCQSASRSIQGYMQSDDPVPDNDTMESLIDTNEQLQTALNQHQRTVLNARKQMGVNEPESNQGAFSSGALSGFDNGNNNSNNEWPNASSTNTTSSNQAELLPELGSSSSYAGNGKGKEATNGSGSGSGSGAAYGVYSGSAGPSGSAVSGTHGSGSNELDPFADPPQSDEPRTHHDPFDRPFASSSSAAPAASATDGGADKIVALDRDDYGKGPAYRY